MILSTSNITWRYCFVPNCCVAHYTIPVSCSWRRSSLSAGVWASLARVAILGMLDCAYRENYRLTILTDFAVSVRRATGWRWVWLGHWLRRLIFVCAEVRSRALGKRDTSARLISLANIGGRATPSAMFITSDGMRHFLRRVPLLGRNESCHDHYVERMH